MKSTFLAICLTVVGAMALMAVAPADAEAQCGDRGNCGDGGHTLSSDGEQWDNSHTYCGYCVWGGMGCHDPCTPGDLEEDQQLVLRELRDVASEGDVEAVLRLAVLLPEKYAFYNSERSSIQITDCSGETLVANLPLDAPQIAMAERLPGDRLALAAEDWIDPSN